MNELSVWQRLSLKADKYTLHATISDKKESYMTFGPRSAALRQAMVSKLTNGVTSVTKRRRAPKPKWTPTPKMVQCFCSQQALRKGPPQEH